MDRGTTISAIGHGALILWVALGDWLFAPADLPPIEVAEVSLMSEADYQAMVASAPKPKDPATKPTPKPAVEAPAPIEPDLPAAEPLPEPKPEPVVQPEPLPEAVPVSPDVQPVEAPDPVAPLAAEEQPIAVPDSTNKPKPRPIDRVAATPVDDTTDTPDIADTPTPEVSDQAAPDAPVVVEDQPAASPEEAAPVIVTEEVVTADDAPQLAPTSSRRPQSRPEKQVVADNPPEDPAPDTTEDTQAADDAQAEAIAAAAAEAAAEAIAEAAADTGSQDLPEGPPVTAGEKEGMKVAVKQCWNLGSLSSAALRVSVTVSVDMGEDGVPDAGSIRMIGYDGGDESSAKMMFEVARRAIIRCGKGGYPLPPEKYAQWKELELVFDPSGMRLR